MTISETEAYDGEKDLACHASKGKTPRNEVMYGEAGVIYLYLCYGMHWLLNIVRKRRLPLSRPFAGNSGCQRTWTTNPKLGIDGKIKSQKSHPFKWSLV